MHTLSVLPKLFTILSLVIACGCSDSSDQPRDNALPVEPLPEPPRYLTIADPAITAPPEVGSISLLSTTFDLESVGYQQQEFFLAGDAQAFTAINTLAPAGDWEVEAQESAAYKTRIVVYRPIDSAAFSGTVLVEWLNVSAGFETPPSWGAGHTEIRRSGHAWVGVSAQIMGIEGSEGGLLPLYLKAANPERYATLTHPGDSFSYDIFSQVAQVLRHPQGVDLLDGLQPETLIAIGESQSAFRLVTYINALQPLYNAFDGYLVHSRGGGSAALAQPPQTELATPEVVQIRADLNVPVLTFQTETDLFYLGFITSRQEDSDRFRLWEVPGTAHADYYTTVIGRSDVGSDPQFAVIHEESSVLGFINCDAPLNSGPQPWVFNAALNALNTWVRTGEAPALADRLAVNDAMSAFSLDAHGNVLGGIRTPYVDTPAAVLSGEGQSGGGFCALFGTTELFDSTTMAALYVDQAGYRQAVSDATADAVARGFLLAEDGDRIIAAADLQWQLLP